MRRLDTLLSCLILAVAANAGDTPGLAGLLPANTPVYIETKNPPLEELKQQAIYQCLEDPAIKAVLERLFQGDSMSQSMPVGSGALVMKSDLRDMSVELQYVERSGAHRLRLRNMFAFAWVGLAEGALPVDVVFAVGVDEAEGAIETLRHLGAAVSLSTRRDTQKPRTTRSEIDRIFTSFRHGGREVATATFGDISVHMTTIGKLLILTSTEARIRDMIDRASTGKKDSLASAERFVKLKANARGTGSHTAVMTIQVDSTLNTLQQVFPGPVAMMRGSLGVAGLGGLKTLSSVSRVDGRGISNTTSVLLERQGTGPGLFKPGKPVAMKSLRFAPKSSFYVNCMGFDPDNLSAFPAMAVAGGMFQQRFGLRLKEDLFDAMGHEIGLIVSPNEGLVPDIGIVMHCRDAARLEKSVLAMLARVQWPAGASLQAATIRGVKVHAAPLLHPRLGNVPIAPTFGVVGDALVIAPSPMAFQRFLAVYQGDRESIAKNRDFALLKQRVPENAEGVSYLNLPRFFTFIYDTLVPILQAIPQPGGSAPIYELPEAQIFSKYLYGRIAWTVTDDDGWHWISHAPLDMSGFMIAGVIFGGVFTSVAVDEPQVVAPPIAKHRHDHEAMQCEQNIRMLAARLRYYRRQNKVLPDELKALKAEYLPESTFVVPGTDKEYVYLGPEGKGRVLLHGYPNGEDQRICVLTQRMKLMRVSASRLRSLLDPQAATEDR